MQSVSKRATFPLIMAVSCTCLGLGLVSQLNAEESGQIAGVSRIEGEAAECRVKVGKNESFSRPDQNESFSRVWKMTPRTLAEVEVKYPQGRKGETVVIEAHDGGLLNKNKSVVVATLGTAKKIHFTFTTGENAGLYQVTLKKGHDIKNVEFWVGAEPEPARK
jgi:broad specificity phosphatase PhoE